MAGFIGKMVFGKILKENVGNKFGTEDPYFEYPASDLSKAGKKKSKRRKKALPPGLTEEEGLVLTKVKRRAYRLDMSFGSFLGLRFGWSSVIGIIPGIGDVADALLALMVVRTARTLELPMAIMMQMIFNIALDFVLGLVPFLGDLVDAGYKCNSRNALLLEKHLRAVGQKRLKQQGITNEEDPSLPGYESPHEVDIESQVPAPERSHRGGGRRDDRFVDTVNTVPGRTHSKTIKKNQRDGTRRGR